MLIKILLSLINSFEKKRQRIDEIKFKIGDDVRVICRCDEHWCKRYYHNNLGVVVYFSTFRQTLLYTVLFEDGVTISYPEKNLTFDTKEVIKNELKGLLE